MVETSPKRFKEKLNINNLKYLAGALEVGGVYNFIKTASSYRPHISITDNQEELQQIKDIYGGTVNKAPPNSWTWEIFDDEAIQLGKNIYMYTPSRRATVDAFDRFNNELVGATKRIIVNAENKRDRFLKIDQEDYRELILDPYFIAGVIDNRGVFTRTIKKSGNIYKRLALSSKNRALLEALQSVHGGSLSPALTTGKSKKTVWTLFSDDVERLISKVENILILKKNKLAQWSIG